MIGELLNALFFIFMAEMGDKTQILAMAFATKYPLRKVLIGVALGSFFNHGLAVLLGTYLSRWASLDLGTIRLVAAFAFVGFGIWTLKIAGEEEDEEDTKYKLGPVFTVSMAFFIGELGDKTQLTAITLATESQYPLFLLIGSILGMVCTSALGVFVGSRLGKKIPEVTLKIASASIFIGFGILALKDTIPSQFMTPTYITIFLLLLAGIVVYRLRKIMKVKATMEDTPLKKAAGNLYINTQRIQQALQTVCTLDDQCLACQQGKCTIRCLNEKLEMAKDKEEFLPEEEWDIPLCKHHHYDSKNLRQSLVETLNTCHECSYHQKKCVGNQTRMTLEKLLFGENIPYHGNRDEYFEEIKKRDPEFFDELDKSENEKE
ncbi:TMEM165/GDT1 family protein [Alkaliphilus hydrothermalis]|uniref:GDT1 family protein n=1 Tax=Alkaliphilus hydrothermalis TaxID=1482730 RepID=A0ABS2NNG4_9FIRM|nr:TMEM165/GDT1 family protein [Alkaliphilus hydrothermalis]MBM7614470.1 putative Ca2+/H+ antiporter (TMEM165/GDT1 family) [Alkaliphilus hydrothermalis]